jgi:hypothetical protein
MKNYQILSRLLYYVPYHSPIHPGRMLTTLSCLTTIVETLNGNGVSYSANIKLSTSKKNMGLAFLHGALIAQFVVLVAFVSLTGYLHYRYKMLGPYPKNVKDVLITLYISSALIGVHAIYRTVEYYSISSFRINPHQPFMNPSSIFPIIRYEAFFWVFETLLMLINSFLLNFRNPMAVLPIDSRIYLTEDGTSEIVRPGYEDVRFFLIAMVDPFDVIGLILGRNRTKEFWKTNSNGKEIGESTASPHILGDQEHDVEKAASRGTDSSGVEVGQGTEKTIAAANVSGATNQDEGRTTADVAANHFFEPKV